MGSVGGVVPALTTTQELRGAASKPHAQWWWKEKAEPAYARFQGNLVILPTGKILALGGKTQVNATWPIHYIGVPEMFDPRSPGSAGTWTPMAPRWVDPNGYPIPREDHSMAMLLPSGRVLLLGGKNLDPTLKPIPHPSDEWAEIFNPPYMDQPDRPGLVNVPPPPASKIAYGTTFCVEVDDPQDIDHACLIGIASVTHNFDYGQRYIELWTQPVPAGCTGPGYTGNLKVTAPPIPAMAPAGYYLLFVLDDQGRPSNGQFVRVDYP